MAIIRMLNDEVHEVRESAQEIFGMVVRCHYQVPLIELQATNRPGEESLWLNAAAISSLGDVPRRP